MKKINDESNNKQNLCTPKFRCKKPYGSPECEYFEKNFAGDCLWYDRNSYRSCANDKAREAVLDKVVEFVRKANTDDGFMAG